MSAGEKPPSTSAHGFLERVALAWLVTRGYRAAALEVRVPWGGYIVDAAGYGDIRDTEGNRVRKDGRLRKVARLCIVECKAFRADFLRDNGHPPALNRKLTRLSARLELAKERIRHEEPRLYAGGLLFPECGPWRYEDSRDPRFRRLLQSVRTLERRLARGSKLHRLKRAGFAHRHFILALPGVVRLRDLPPGWGLLETRVPRKPAEPLAVLERVSPPFQETGPARTQRMLARIATRASSAAQQQAGVLIRADQALLEEKGSAPRMFEARMFPGTENTVLRTFQ